MDEDVWLTASEAATRLGVSRSTVWRMTPAELPYILTRGSQRRYRLADVLRRLGQTTVEERLTALEERVTRLEDGR